INTTSTPLRELPPPAPNPPEPQGRSMAAAGWLRRAAAAAAAAPRLPSGLPLIPPPPPAPLAEAQSLVVPGLGAAVAPTMELMAVPKKKVSKYKKGLRNGPKALKPVPVIVRCRCCGRVKLPHFYCCSGERGNPSESSS
ncbi:unnamed protein product, partial [Urochloa humidicola]